jgi:hypothetical protein
VIYKVEAAAIGSPAEATISGTLARFEPEQVHARWEAALDRRATDPAGAITLARTLLEDVFRWLLDDITPTLEAPATDQDDLPQLYRKLSKALNLAPDGHSEPVFKQILGNCQSIVRSLGALRNRLGDAHSSGARRSPRRDAELAVNLAGSMATFLVATWKLERKRSLRTKQRPIVRPECGRKGAEMLTGQLNIAPPIMACHSGERQMTAPVKS